MIGIYDYTVVLTYLSMISGVIGIIFTMTGLGHPYCGVVFLLISGLFDTFDGKVARTKKDRNDIEKNFGVQIDSLADLIAFGVLPAAIGISQLRRSGIFTELLRRGEYEGKGGIIIILITIAVLYVLAALIRLAYFNATEDLRAAEAKETGSTFYSGVPVTTAALIFPLTLILHYYTRWNMTYFYFVVMLVTAMAFVLNIKIKKPGKVGLSIMMLLGLVELYFTIMIFYKG